MKCSTPFFAGFHRLLFGTPARSAASRFQKKAEELRQASLSQLARLFEPWLPPEKIIAPIGSRMRYFPTRVTFWAFFSQVLSPGSPCREALAKIQAWYAQLGAGRPDSDTGAYCKARKRLDSGSLRKLHAHTSDRLQAGIRSSHLWCGRRVKVVDGTGVSMPDTPANQKAFPQPSTQKAGCGFPVAHITACFCLASGALIDWAEGTLKNHEYALFRRLWSVFEAGDIFLSDRGFCAFEAIAQFLNRGVDSVVRLHQARCADFRFGRKIRKNERLVTWTKPKKRPKDCGVREWAKLPSELTLRYVKIQVATPGFRTRELIVVTTLLDPDDYSAEALGELYLRRWRVELFFRDIKITLGMDVLRCKSPDMVRKEIILHAIAYNLIRALMQKAAAQYKVELSRISFKGTVDRLRQWSDTLNSSGTRPRKFKQMTDQFLETIAEDPLPDRPDRAEPRAKKRRPKNYQLLTKPRHEMVVSDHRRKP